MIKATKILFGVTSKAHTEIGLDEVFGLEELGFEAGYFEYGGKKNVNSSIGKFTVIMINAFNLLFKTYKFKPSIIYLNSRVEYIAAVRDFFTIFLIKLFYFKKVHFLIKSHGSDLEVLQSDKTVFKKIIFPFLIKEVRAWLFLSTEEINWIGDKGLINKNRLFLTKNIVRTTKFLQNADFRKFFNITEDETILLFAGRLVEDKGTQYVVDAFANLLSNYKAKLFIVGDGEQLAAIKMQVSKLGITNNVIITGWVGEEEVAHITGNCDLLIYPTYANEGFPMALFNSLAAGLAIVTTQIRAAQDYLKEPENCIWVQAKSADSIEKAVSKILDNKELMVDMRKNNKIKAQLFTRKYVCRDLSLIINTIEMDNLNVSYRQLRDN